MDAHRYGSQSKMIIFKWQRKQKLQNSFHYNYIHYISAMKFLAEKNKILNKECN